MLSKVEEIVGIIVVLSILLLVLLSLWVLIGVPVSLQHETITISSAVMISMFPYYGSPYYGVFSHGECIITDTSGIEYSLEQDINSKYWCIQGWNRSEEIHAGQIYNVNLQHNFFNGDVKISSMERVSGGSL